MISKKISIPMYVKITNFENGLYIRNKRRVRCVYNGIGRLKEIGDTSSLVEIAIKNKPLAWIPNKCLDWETNIAEINVVETEVEANQTEVES